MKEIYIIYLVDINTISEEDMRSKFDYYKKKYNKYDMSFNRYVELMKSWNEYPYCFTIDPEGYYDNYEKAIKFVRNNGCDINESGSFPYVVVASMPLNCIYPNCISDRKFELFEYKSKINGYVQVNWDKKELACLLNFAEHGGM